MLKAVRPSTRDRLLADIHNFVIDFNLSESALGRKSIGSARLVERLRSGKGITIDNLDKIYAFMAAERAAREAPAGEG